MNEKKKERQYLCLVDEKGRFLGEEEKKTCHINDGLLHSAFMVMIFNEKNELMIARRSAQKKLWPGYWDGTVASHYFKDKPQHETAVKRLQDEIGVKTENLEYLFKFRYQARYEEVGSENEICDVYMVRGVNTADFKLNLNEISEYRFLPMPNLNKDMNENHHKYTPWFLIALEMFLNR